MKLKWKHFYLAFFFLISLSSFAQTDYRYFASRISHTYESNLSSLPQTQQEHFAVRLFRTTNSRMYVPPVRVRADDFYQTFREGLAHFDDSIYIKQYLKDQISELTDGLRGRLRREILESGDPILFYMKALVYPLSKLHEYNLPPTQNRLALQRLREIDFKSRILQPNFIVAWAAPTANYVYWLYQLGIADLRADLKNAFAAAFPMDGSLDGEEFLNQLYGLTHFIIAASEYYQKYVSPEDFQWILDFFDKHQEKILATNNPDIIAEVGVNFLLAQQTSHPLIERCRLAVARHFDPKLGMILGKHGSTDLKAAEHRNTLAYLLYLMPTPLYPGPDLQALPFSENAQIPTTVFSR